MFFWNTRKKLNCFSLSTYYVPTNNPPTKRPTKRPTQHQLSEHRWLLLLSTPLFCRTQDCRGRSRTTSSTPRVPRQSRSYQVCDPGPSRHLQRVQEPRQQLVFERVLGLGTKRWCFGIKCRIHQRDLVQGALEAAVQGPALRDQVQLRRLRKVPHA